MDRTLKFIKTSGIYFVGSILTKLISFVLLPLYSDKLSTEEFGYYDYTITIITIVVGVVCLEVWVGAIRFLLQKNTKAEKDKIVCNCLLLIGISMAIFLCIVIVVKKWISIPYLNYIVIYAFFYMLQSLYTAFIRGYQKNVHYIISGLLASIINFLINIYFVGFCGKGVEYLYLAFSIGAGVQIFYIECQIHTVKSLKKKNFDFNLAKKIFIFCFPLFVNSISYWVLTSYSKVIIINHLGASANGVYSMGLRFASAITLVTSVLSLAWQELVFSEKGDLKRLYTKGLTMYYHLLIYAIIAVLPLLNIFYPKLINQKYIAAMTILPICLLNTLSNAFADFVGKVIIAENQTKWIFTSSVLGAAACVLCANLFVGSFQLVGVVTSIFIGFMVSITIRICWLLNKYHCEVKIEDVMIPFVQLVLIVVLYYLLGTNVHALISGGILIWVCLRHRDIINRGIEKGKKLISHEKDNLV